MCNGHVQPPRATCGHRVTLTQPRCPRRRVQLADVIYRSAVQLHNDMADRARRLEEGAAAASHAQDVTALELSGAAAGLSVEALQQKFEQDGAFMLAFGGAREYHDGLEGLVGPAHPDLMGGMREEHTGRDDSDAVLCACCPAALLPCYPATLLHTGRDDSDAVLCAPRVTAARDRCAVRPARVTAA